MSLSNIRTLTLYLIAVGLGCVLGLGRGLVPLRNSAGQAKSGRPLPSVLASVLPEVKAKSGVAVLLPTELPKSFEEAKHALVEKVAANEYAISLYDELGIGNAGFAALFAANATHNYDPRELPGVHEVKLARGIRGYFRPVSCGGSCAPANLWWEQAGVLYQIQLELGSTLPENDQEKTMTAVANSAILAGPR
jgi:hypothetical protein